MSLSELARREAGLVALDALGVLVEQMPRLAQMATQEERAAVVAWLREAAYTTLYDARAWDVADLIERGEHRREEER